MCHIKPISNPYLGHIWVTPVPKIGLWTLSPRFLSGFTSPWAHDPFFLLASGFPFQITWLPVAWACDPFFPTGQRFPPMKKHVTSGSGHDVTDQSEASIWVIRAHITTVDTLRNCTCEISGVSILIHLRNNSYERRHFSISNLLFFVWARNPQTQNINLTFQLKRLINYLVHRNI